MKPTIRVLIVGVAAGAAATQVMDKATTWFYERQGDASKRRENELLPEGAPMASARKPPCTAPSASSTGWSRPP
jgi:hypothetical protein